MSEPFDPGEVRKLLRRILVEGEVRPTPHCRREMAKDGISMVDVERVFKIGLAGPGEWENGEWRYQVEAQGVVVVVAFELESGLAVVVVTSWRRK